MMDLLPFSINEIQQFRNETRGAKDGIHFNNAGASFPPDLVLDTVISYLQEEAVLGGYETEAKYSVQLDNVYTSVARLVNAEKNEIALLENASMAWLLAFNGIPFTNGDEVITGELEYVTNIIGFLHAQKKWGIKIIIVPNDDQGNFSLEHFKAAISAKTKLIAMTHIASSTGGSMLPIIEIGKLAKQYNILYLLDACQSIGQFPIDVKAINCDMLSATGRKYLRAPRGTGFLFVKKEIQHSLHLLLLDGSTARAINENDFTVRDDAKRFELFEKNRALLLGLGKAADYAFNIGMERIWQRIQLLGVVFRKKLQSIEKIAVHDRGDHQCGIVTFTIDGIDSSIVKDKLSENKINAWVGLVKSTLYYMHKNNLTNVVRVSVHYYNTEEEINACCNLLRDLFDLPLCQG